MRSTVRRPQLPPGASAIQTPNAVPSSDQRTIQSTIDPVPPALASSARSTAGSLAGELDGDGVTRGAGMSLCFGLCDAGPEVG
jgi:hypothetical protein